jgi:small subunit ribosomal protein S9
MATAKYTEAIGRRKTASARVRITPAKSTSMTVNGKEAHEYFPLAIQMKTAFEPLQVLGATFAVTAKVSGGGTKAQAEAIRLGISRPALPRT